MTTQFPARKSTGRWVGSLLYGMLFIVVGALGAGAVALLAQFQNLTGELAATRRDMSVSKERIARLEKRLDEGPVGLASRQLPAQGRSASEEDQSQPPLQLSREEIQLVKDYIKVPPPPPGATGLIKLGSTVPPTAMLAPLPTQITDKLPRLLGARFMTDSNGSIVIVRRASRIADAVITSN